MNLPIALIGGIAVLILFFARPLLGLLAGAALLIAGVLLYKPDPPPPLSATATPPVAAPAERRADNAAGWDAARAAAFRARRDDGIRMIGWLAGNAALHPVWPRLEPYVGRDGEFYRFFLALAPPGLPAREQEAEAFGNVSLYRDWVDKGRAAPYDEIGNANKLERLAQLPEEILTLLR